ncbi:hypothetical protein EIP91_011818 [Steccherinum ochraceum]|uniref:MARVEL domain-containing protein n=1 Tax=Steccherinum ochraceum TaxID=92696 RepID=A0A4R0RXV9_9APHY|nr:hypothetical protein EIP91_011818 [Steccherinum ochraceum]
MSSRFDVHIRRGQPITMGLLVFFSIIELSISAWLTARFNQHHNFPSSSVRDKTRFILFCSAWTILGAGIYMTLFLLSAGTSALTSVGSHALFLFMTWVFWLSAAASITAAYSGGLSCKGNHPPYCGQQNAQEGFAWILWVLSTFALLMIILRGVAATRRGDGLRGGLIA